MDNGKKTTKKLLCLSQTEAQLLKEKAKLNHMNESEYLRFMISQKPNDYPEIKKLLKELINEVNHIGVNINQIVKHHNASFYSQEEKTQLVAYMKKLNKSVKEAVELFGNN